METFSFPYHVPTHAYPKGDSFKFGRGYEFSSAPALPIQRRFKLFFNAMIWYFDAVTGAADNSTDPELNMMALMEFYERHLTHKKFIYEHEIFGTLIVKFASDVPFEVPKSIQNSGGVVEPFELVLVEQPL